MDRKTVRDLLVFALLVTFACIIRWEPGRPWEFTPLAAVAVFAGFYFDRFGVALLVPLAARAISDAGLSAHDSLAVVFCIYAFALVPVGLGRLLRNHAGRANASWRSTIALWTTAAFLPAVAFFVVTNFAVWASLSLYPATWSGLLDCYVPAIPFFRSMLLGDLFFMAVLFGSYAVSTRRGHAAAPLARGYAHVGRGDRQRNRG